MAATAEKTSNAASSGKAGARDPAKEMLLRNTLDVLRAFMECSDAIQHGVLEMAQIVTDPNIDEDEKVAAGDTLIEALYPSYVGEELGIDIAAYDELHRKSEPELEGELDNEEETFAAKLNALMEKNGVTQDRLAKLIEVGQPAISMMLARGCRPQRRTVERIAEALNVSVEELWPNKK